MNSDFRGFISPASLKLVAAVIHGVQHALHFRGVTAPASLKPYVVAGVDDDLLVFPGRNRPGLIEAYVM